MNDNRQPQEPNFNHDSRSGCDTPSPRLGRRLSFRCFLVAIALVWLTTIAAGSLLLIDYHTRPGAVAVARAHEWPTSSMKLSTQVATVVMFIHPKCPCSNASLAEFEALLAQSSPAPNSYIVLVNELDGHSPTGISARAHDMAGVTVVTDPLGREAHLFGSQTSGDLFVFDRSGRLTFQGGITGGRGHFGENISSQFAKDAILKGHTLVQRPVFGCPLRNSNSDESTAAQPRQLEEVSGD